MKWVERWIVFFVLTSPSQKKGTMFKENLFIATRDNGPQMVPFYWLREITSSNPRVQQSQTWLVGNNLQAFFSSCSSGCLIVEIPLSLHDFELGFWLSELQVSIQFLHRSSGDALRPRTSSTKPCMHIEAAWYIDVPWRSFHRGGYLELQSSEMMRDANLHLGSFLISGNPGVPRQEPPT